MCSARAPGSDAAATGGCPSFETVIELFHKRIYNLVYRLLGDFDEAADLAQETFVKAYKAYSRFRGTSEAVYPWLCQIAVNGCKNKFKEKGRRNRYEIMSLDESVETEDSSLLLEIGDESASPADICERRELEAKIHEAIQALPPEFRVVLVLRDMQGLSYKEIADATGLTMEAVKSRLFRGRGVLRRRLAAYVGKPD
ncbi:MAG TPA: sigma-70 family RNA polymerase sigma factor [Armatimonadota bacterium]|nr:sigma-70 family RNA polymerase sigma factor [Armatimonadota bacterium]